MTPLVGPSSRGFRGALGLRSLAGLIGLSSATSTSPRRPRRTPPPPSPRSAGRATEFPSNPRAWLGDATARNRAIDPHPPRSARWPKKTRQLEVPAAAEENRGRADLSPTSAWSSSSRAVIRRSPSKPRSPSPCARSRGLDTGEDRSGLPGPRGDDGPAARARQAQDESGRDPLPGSGRPICSPTASPPSSRSSI